jgi:carboxylesterase
MFKKPFGVLILHGFTSSIECVSEIEPPMKALKLPTRMPILRGHGAESPEALRGVKHEDWLADGEAALLDLLKEAEKAIVIGLSMGGLVALDLAAKYPEKIDSIVLAAAAVQLSNPLAPNRPMSFLRPVVKLLFKKWFVAPVRADESLLQYDNNYPWAPMDSINELLEYMGESRKTLARVHTPALILQSRKDAVVVPESAEIIYNGIATPKSQKKIIWYEVTNHEMFRDCEREKIIKDIEKYVKGRIGKK